MAASTTVRFIEVALPLPLFQTFAYRVDGEPRHPLVPGSRVVVPFRNRRAIGICVGIDAAAPAAGVAKPILEVPDAEPALDSHALALGRWLSEYYAVPLGVALRSALPVLLTRSSAATPPRKTRRIVVLRQELPSLLQRDRLFARSPRQREVFEYLESVGGRSSVEHSVGAPGLFAVRRSWVGRSGNCVAHR